jgi:hypothetical protein
VQSSLVEGQVSNDQKKLQSTALLKKISPVAWQNIHFHGRYTFCGSRHPINLDAMVANLTLEEGWTRATSIVDSIRLPKCHGKLPDGNFGGLGLQPRIAFGATRIRLMGHRPVMISLEEPPCLSPNLAAVRVRRRELPAGEATQLA